MGKITVKYYLEKKVKPTTIYGGVVAYPLYVRITVNRKTTQLKSLTGTLMSEVAFETYKKNGNIDYNESFIENNINHYLTLSDEPDLIQLGIKTITEKYEDYDFSDRNIRSLLSLLLTNAQTAFIKIAWARETYSDLETDAFIGSFNQNKSLINSIKHFQNVLGIDITTYIPDDYFKMWQVIELIKCIGVKEKSFVEFINLDYPELLIKASKVPTNRDYCLISDNHNISSKEITTIATHLEKGYLGYL